MPGASVSTLACSARLHELAARAADRRPDGVALTDRSRAMTYAELAADIDRAAAGLQSLGLRRGQRVGVWLEKRLEAVVACFAATRADGVMVPINPILKAEQVAHILRDAQVSFLVTSPARCGMLQAVLPACPGLEVIVLTDEGVTVSASGLAAQADPSCPRGPSASDAVVAWSGWLDRPAARANPSCALDTDLAAILYTSGSTGRPKGVMLSHRNLVVGAGSVASYLRNGPDDVLVAALPLSFDAGFSQLTTAMYAGARVVLMNYLLPRDLLQEMAHQGVTGLTAVPPLYMQLASIPDWPDGVARHLRYFANTGGRLPLATLQALRQRVPRAAPFLMYGLTEAFRSTYLPPEQVDHRPDSIGRAIPNAEILVLREDGSECGVDEPGELVHRGPLVGLGYWGDPVRTAERYRPLPPGVAGRPPGLVMPELAVYSGDTVRRDAEGYLYFIGRRDEMIKTSGYRVSPTEVEEVVQSTGLVRECAAYGVEHPQLGQAIALAVVPLHGDAEPDLHALRHELRQRLPAYMVPARVQVHADGLPRNPNGKIDRKALS